MKLNLSIIQKELSDMIVFTEQMIDPPLVMSCTYPVIDTDRSIYTEGPVYILTADQISGGEILDGHPSFICIGIPPSSLFKKECNILYTRDRTDPIFLLNQVQQIFYKYYQWETQMQDIIDNELPIKEMGKLSFPFIENPMILQGSGFKVIFQILPSPGKNSTKLHKEYHDGWKSEDNVYIPVDDINLLVTDEEYNRSINTDEPILYSGENYGFRSITYNLRISGIPVARLCVDEILKPFSRYDYALAKILGDFLRKALRNLENSNFNRPQQLNEVLEHLLSHRLVPEEKISLVLSEMGWNTADTYFCVLMRQQIQHTEDTLSSLAFHLIMALPTDCHIIYKNGIVLLFNLTQTGLSRKEVIRQCKPHFRDNLLKAGISTEFHDFKDLFYYYLQAESALDLGQKKDSTFWYFRFEDYNLFYLIEKCRSKQIGMALIPDGLKRLMRHDRQKHTNYVSLLHIYLEHDRNIAETARVAYLHRNTLLYQINNINKISQLDLDDPDIRLHLMISFKILNHSPESVT